MAAAEAAPAPPPGEAKRPEGDEWCDSGLGSLGEGQLGPLPASPGPASPPGPGPAEPPREEREEEAVAAAVDPAVWLRHVLSFLTEDGDTALHLAVIHEHEPFLDSILQHTAGTPFLDLQNDLGQTALHIAVILGLSGFVGKLRGAGAGLGVQERGGHTPLHLACREGRRGCARRLLAPLSGNPPGAATDPPQHPQERAQLDSVNYDGYTPLHIAVLRKDLELVELLLHAGADPNKPEPSCGRTPLHLAVEAQSPEVAEALLKGGLTRPPECTWGTPPSTAPATAPTPACPPSCAATGPPTAPPQRKRMTMMMTMKMTAPRREGATTATRNTTTSSSTAGAAWTDGGGGDPPPAPQVTPYLSGGSHCRWLDFGGAPTSLPLPKKKNQNISPPLQKET